MRDGFIKIAAATPELQVADCQFNKDKLVEKAKEMVKLNKDTQAYCDSFERVCQGCKVKEFKDKYSRFGKMICTDVFKYLKEKGEI